MENTRIALRKNDGRACEEEEEDEEEERKSFRTRPEPFPAGGSLYDICYLKPVVVETEEEDAGRDRDRDMRQPR